MSLTLSLYSLCPIPPRFTVYHSPETQAFSYSEWQAVCFTYSHAYVDPKFHSLLGPGRAPFSGLLFDFSSESCQVLFKTPFSKKPSILASAQKECALSPNLDETCLSAIGSYSYYLAF